MMDTADMATNVISSTRKVTYARKFVRSTETSSTKVEIEAKVDLDKFSINNDFI